MYYSHSWYLVKILCGMEVISLESVILNITGKFLCLLNKRAAQAILCLKWPQDRKRWVWTMVGDAPHGTQLLGRHILLGKYTIFHIKLPVRESNSGPERPGSEPV